MSNGTRVMGSLRSVDGKGTVRMEDRFETDIADLWSALTDPRRLARWMAEVKGDLRPGGEFRVRFISTWEGMGRVEACESPRRLLLTMIPDQGGDETVVEARLAAEGDQTLLVIEERGLPVDEFASHGAGWQAHIEDLATYLAGGEPGDWHSRWTELTPTYEALAGK